MTFKAKLGTGNAPVIDLGTERHGRAVRKVNELRAIYPDAELAPPDEHPTESIPVREGAELVEA